MELYGIESGLLRPGGGISEGNDDLPDLLFGDGPDSSGQ